MARKQTNTLVPTNSARFIKKIPTTECVFRMHFLVSKTCSLFFVFLCLLMLKLHFVDLMSPLKPRFQECCQNALQASLALVSKLSDISVGTLETKYRQVCNEDGFFSAIHPGGTVRTRFGSRANMHGAVGPGSGRDQSGFGERRR